MTTASFDEEEVVSRDLRAGIYTLTPGEILTHLGYNQLDGLIGLHSMDRDEIYELDGLARRGMSSRSAPNGLTWWDYLGINARAVKGTPEQIRRCFTDVVYRRTIDAAFKRL
jgi:hypothetical protein